MVLVLFETQNEWIILNGRNPSKILLDQNPITNISYLYLLCLIEKYLFVIFFKGVDKITIVIRFGKVIKPSAASPKPQTASSSAIAPINTKTKNTIL